MLTPQLPPKRIGGFTLIEMIVTITILGLLTALAMPAILGWVRTNKIRTVSDSLQNGLRLAQSEATRRSRQVVFSLTNAKPTSATFTAAANGSNWAITTVAAMTGEARAFIESGVLTDVGSDVQISGPSAICFSAIGRLVANSAPGPTSADCTLPTTTPPVHVYNITISNAVSGVDRRLRVTVALGGQVRLCDPDKTLSDTQPDGCP